VGFREDFRRTGSSGAKASSTGSGGSSRLSSSGSVSGAGTTNSVLHFGHFALVPALSSLIFRTDSQPTHVYRMVIGMAQLIGATLATSMQNRTDALLRDEPRFCVPEQKNRQAGEISSTWRCSLDSEPGRKRQKFWTGMPPEILPNACQTLSPID